ncbi:MAG: methyltransferase [Candidatus Spechtbacterales bacterium]|nr:methyltransferase [Candidatus Spechtbacterales bacterium]
MNKKNPKQLKKDIIFDANIRGHDFKFHSTWGLFSQEKIDAGSELLLEYVKVKPDSRSIDLGCGYGALGIPIAKMSPKGKVHMVDKDFVAVEYANKNAEVNNIPNAKAYLSNMFSEVPEDAKFDLIVSNIPAKVSREMLWIMLADSRKYLVEGGSIYVVTIAGLKQFIKRNFKETFGNYKRVKQGKSHIVASAKK